MEEPHGMRRLGIDAGQPPTSCARHFAASSNVLAGRLEQRICFASLREPESVRGTVFQETGSVTERNHFITFAFTSTFKRNARVNNTYRTMRMMKRIRLGRLLISSSFSMPEGRRFASQCAGISRSVPLCPDSESVSLCFATR